MDNGNHQAALAGKDTSCSFAGIRRRPRSHAFVALLSSRWTVSAALDSEFNVLARYSDNIRLLTGRLDFPTRRFTVESEKRII